MSVGTDAARRFSKPMESDHGGQKQVVTLQGLAGHSTIKIFTVSGHSVQTLTTDSPMTSWNLRNRDGDDVASGIYIYSITSDQSPSTPRQARPYPIFLSM